MANALGHRPATTARSPIQVHTDEPADAPGTQRARGRRQAARRADHLRTPVADLARRPQLLVVSEHDVRLRRPACTFTVVPGAGANGLQALLPIRGSTGNLSQLTRDGQAVGYTTQTVKGVDYAILPNSQLRGLVAPTRHRARPAQRLVRRRGRRHAGLQQGRDDDEHRRCRHRGVTGTTGGTTGANSGGTTAVHVHDEAPPFLRVSARAPSARARRERCVLTVRLRRTARLALTFQTRHGKVVRRIRVARHKAGTVVHLRWDGKDARGRYVAPATYRFTVTAVGSRGYQHTARGSVKVLKAR